MVWNIIFYVCWLFVIFLSFFTIYLFIYLFIHHSYLLTADCYILVLNDESPAFLKDFLGSRFDKQVTTDT